MPFIDFTLLPLSFIPLSQLVMDGNHCTLAGGLLLLRVLESAAPEQDIQISLRECTFEKAGHRVRRCMAVQLPHTCAHSMNAHNEPILVVAIQLLKRI
jgi:hypothetical protein